MKNQLGSSRMDTVLKMLLIAFISLLAFSSGVYFGKQLSDSDYQLKALESDFNHGGVAKSDGQNPEDAINEEEVTALSDKLVNNEKTGAETAAHPAEQGDARNVASADEGHEAPAHAMPAKAAPAHAAEHAAAAPAHAPAHEAKAVAHAEPHAAPQKTAGHPDLSAAAKAAQRVASNAAPIENPKPETHTRVPSSLPKTVGTSQDVEFTVQVASYESPEAAKDHANELVKKGFPAFPVEATVNGKTWYRVSVGSFKTLREATTYRAQLMKQTSLSNTIVQKIMR